MASTRVVLDTNVVVSAHLNSEGYASAEADHQQLLGGAHTSALRFRQSNWPASAAEGLRPS
jgi:hypothetical protein